MNTDTEWGCWSTTTRKVDTLWFVYCIEYTYYDGSYLTHRVEVS